MMEKVEFGKGTVAVMRTSETEGGVNSGVAFAYTEENPVGDVVTGYKGKWTNETGVFLRLHFSSAESVQVLIDELEIVRDDLRPRFRFFKWLKNKVD